METIQLELDITPGEWKHLMTPLTAFKKGDTVTWPGSKMRGKVVDALPGNVRVQWKEGHPFEISGWTLWCPLAYLERKQ